MWQAPNQRIRALQNAKKRQKERLSRPFHLKRVRAELKILREGSSPQFMDGRVLLNDMTPQGMGIFSSHALLVGQEVAITMDEPRQIFLKGRVVWCQEYDAESHILSQNSFSYRMGIKFVFGSAKEEEAVKKFIEELSSHHLYGSAG